MASSCIPAARNRLGCLVFVLSVSIGGSARAQALPQVEVAVISSSTMPCPSPALLLAELRRVRGVQLRLAQSTRAAARVRVEDLGASYRVVVGQAERTFEDPLRRCDERARGAEVFVDFQFNPPDFRDPNAEATAHLPNSPPPPPPPPPPASPSPSLRASNGVTPPLPPSLNSLVSPVATRAALPDVPEPLPLVPPPAPLPIPISLTVARRPGAQASRRLGVELHTAGFFATSPQSADRILVAGGSLRLVLRYWFLGFTVSAALGSSHDYAVGAGTANVFRAPLDIGVRAHFDAGRLQLVGQLALVAAVFVAQGNFPAGASITPQRNTSYELGASATVELRVAVTSWLAPFAGLGLTWMPEGVQLVGGGASVAATYPWLSAIVGLTWKLL